MKLRIVDGYVTDVSADPQSHFHPDIAGQFEDWPADAPEALGIGWRSDGEDWVAPPPPLEPVVEPPKPKILTKLEFTMLAAQAGGMPSVAAAKNDPVLADFWVFFDLATQVERDHVFTQQGLAAMSAAGHLPNGSAAVFAAWPTA